MPQTILAPEDPPTGALIVSGPLSQNEIRLGKVLDLKPLLPGDLVLFSAVNPGVVGRNIRRVQERGGYLPDHAQWEHAAVYLSDGMICEATRRGVNRVMLSTYVGGHRIRARRSKALNLHQRYRLAMHALSSQAYSYNYREILRLWKSARFGFGNTSKANLALLGIRYPKRATICSQLYADCYLRVTAKVIGNLGGGETTPASLSCENELTDIQLNWLSLP